MKFITLRMCIAAQKNTSFNRSYMKSVPTNPESLPARFGITTLVLLRHVFSPDVGWGVERVERVELAERVERVERSVVVGQVERAVVVGLLLPLTYHRFLPPFTPWHHSPPHHADDITNPTNPIGITATSPTNTNLGLVRKMKERINWLCRRLKRSLVHLTFHRPVQYLTKLPM